MMESPDSTDTKTWQEVLQQRIPNERGAQAKFAREIGCSESHLSLVLKGKRRVSYPIAEKINARTGIPIEKIMAPTLVPEGGAS